MGGMLYSIFWVFSHGGAATGLSISIQPTGASGSNAAENPRMVTFHLKQLKTDQMGQGAYIVLGRTDLSV